MALVALLWTPVLHRLRRPRLSPALALAALALLAATLPVARWLIPAALTPVETGYYRYSLGEMIAILLRNFSMGLRPADGLWPVAAFAALMVGGLLPLAYTAPAATDWPTRRAATLLAAYLAAPLLAIWLVSLRRPTFTDRYLIISLPAFYMMIASGIAALAHLAAAARSHGRRSAHPVQAAAVRRRRIAATRAGQPRSATATASAPAPATKDFRSWPSVALLLTALLVVACVPFLWRQTHNPYKADFRAATRYLTSQAAPDDLVLFVMPYVERGFSYYHRQPVRTAEPPFTRDMTPGQVDAALRAITSGSRRVWLFLSEAEFWDDRGQIAAWFEAHATRRCAQEFAYIEVRCYDVR